MKAAFDFDIAVSYDYVSKRKYHLVSKSQLRKLAQALGLKAGEFDLRSNMGGDAVSGEVTLHTDNLYVQVSQPFADLLGILLRTCKGRKDYCGGPNHFAPANLLNSPQLLAEHIRKALGV